MSVIAAIKLKNKTILCADTQISCGDEKMHKINKINLKLTVLKNGIIIGHTGFVKNSQYICANEQWFNFEGILTKEYIVTNIIPQIIKGLHEQSLLTKTKNGFYKMESELIIAHKNNLFVVYNDFSVYEINNYVALGAGGNFCLPYLQQLPKTNVSDYLFNMLMDASENYCSISPPFVFINSNKPNNIKIVYDSNFKL